MSSPEESSPLETDQSERKPSKRRTAIAVLLVLAVVVLLVLPVFSTLQPGYYERYGSMRVRMDEWRQSTHARMTCTECHVNPGVGGFLTFAARSVPAFYSQLIFGPKETNLLKAPDAVACQKCHTGFRQVSPDGDLLIPHRAHVEILKINCVDCHENLVHSPNPAGINRPKMVKCLRCHNGKTAEDACTDCHTRKQSPANHKDKNWLTVHSEVAKQGGCGECHAWSPDFCKECHKRRPTSHAGNWKTSHQVRARQNEKECRVCHTQQFCDECH